MANVQIESSSEILSHDGGARIFHVEWSGSGGLWWGVGEDVKLREEIQAKRQEKTWKEKIKKQHWKEKAAFRGGKKKVKAWWDLFTFQFLWSLEKEKRWLNMYAEMSIISTFNAASVPDIRHWEGQLDGGVPGGECCSFYQAIRVGNSSWFLAERDGEAAWLCIIKTGYCERHRCRRCCWYVLGSYRCSAPVGWDV